MVKLEDLHPGDIIACCVHGHYFDAEIVIVDKDTGCWSILALVPTNVNLGSHVKDLAEVCSLWYFTPTGTELPKYKMLQHKFCPIYLHEILRKLEDQW